ncbi:CPBP family intramembrane glutamic endopeptidase [Nocardioides sp. C4-1]|uniref:CPBP family intramembrane glutamic endopeptidase n=1 Tax=Nocardioides sp. C4-1 TaxID=3151851 RepID=UPI003265831E
MSDPAAFTGNPYHPDTAGAGEPTTLEYQQIDRAGREPQWAWSLLSVVSAVAGFVLVQLVLGLVVLLLIVLGLVVGGVDPEQAMDAVSDLDDPQPSTLAFLLVTISLSIPVIMGLHRAITGLSPRWLISVAGRIRWGWLFTTMGIALATLIVNVVLGAVLPISGDADASGGLNDLTATAVRFLLVVLFLVPFQAAAEEYVFRGLMMQALGSISTARWVSRVVSVVVPALIFALFHGAQSVPVFFDRFAFGVVAGVLAIVTGGIEAGIGYHVVNNWLAFTIAVLFSDVGSSLNPEGGNGWNIVVTLVSSGTFLGLTWGAARLMNLQTTVERATVLAQPAGRV